MAVKPKLCMIPSGVGTDTLYSVLPSDGTGDFTFDRNLNTATRINKDGLIEMVDADIPRLNYPLIDGVVQGCPSLLLENSSTNLVTYSEDFSNAYWNKGNSSVISNSVISPDGTLNADKLVEDTNTGNHNIGRTGGFFPIGTHTLSFFAKKGENEYIIFGNSSAGDFASFDLNSGSILSTDNDLDNSSIEEFPNGWYRCSITITRVTAANFALYMSKDGSTRSYTGDGTSGVYLWGAQLEQQSYPTSYIPSLTGSQTTRSAETCNNSGDANTFNDSEGVLMAEISALANDGTNRILSISDSTTSNRVFIRIDDDLNQISVRAGSGSVISVDNYDTTTFNKILVKYKQNDVVLWINGFKEGTVTSSNMPTGLSELAFDKGDGSSDFYGNTKQLQYFDTALTDTDLEELTSWTSFNEMATAQLYTIE